MQNYQEKQVEKERRKRERIASKKERETGRVIVPYVATRKTNETKRRKSCHRDVGKGERVVITFS